MTLGPLLATLGHSWPLGRTRLIHKQAAGRTGGVARNEGAIARLRAETSQLMHVALLLTIRLATEARSWCFGLPPTYAERSQLNQ
jgi:hypothetical protein